MVWLLQLTLLVTGGAWCKVKTSGFLQVRPSVVVDLEEVAMHLYLEDCSRQRPQSLGCRLGLVGSAGHSTQWCLTIQGLILLPV